MVPAGEVPCVVEVCHMESLAAPAAQGKENL
jgi:hypothetical protein